MHFLPNVYVTCEECKGRRYNRETLEIHYRGKSIADVLDLTVDQALPLLENFPPIAQQAAHAAGRRPRLHRARAVGDDAVSGGEAQRVKLGARAVEARHRPHALHPRRADHRPALRGRARSCSTCWASWSTRATRVLVIEHNLDVDPVGRPRASIWGPKAATAGGRVVGAGHAGGGGGVHGGSHTGAFLADAFAAEAAAGRRALRADQPVTVVGLSHSSDGYRLWLRSHSLGCRPVQSESEQFDCKSTAYSNDLLASIRLSVTRHSVCSVAWCSLSPAVQRG